MIGSGVFRYKNGKKFCICFFLKFYWTPLNMQTLKELQFDKVTWSTGLKTLEINIHNAFLNIYIPIIYSRISE